MAIDWHKRFSQQAHWTFELRRFWYQRFQDSPLHNVLEVGCGTGAVLADSDPFGLRHPGLNLVGLDIDPDFLMQASRNVPSARLVLGDAHALPFETNLFDLVYFHFLLLWVEYPLEVLLESQRITRSGGWVAAFAEPDYGGRIDYPDEIARLGVLQEESLRQKGAQTRLGRSLKALFYQAGFKDIECGVLGARWTKGPSNGDSESEWDVLRFDIEGLISEAEFSRLEILASEARRTGEDLLFVPTFFAVGRV